LAFRVDWSRFYSLVAIKANKAVEMHAGSDSEESPNVWHIRESSYTGPSGDCATPLYFLFLVESSSIFLSVS
jgi:hypothetical protein